MKELDEVDGYEVLNNSLEILQQIKPNDRSAMDRRYAIVITDLEKIIAYYNQFILDGQGDD